MVITPNQLALVNGIIQERDGLRLVLGQTDSLVVVQDSLISTYCRQIASYRELNSKNEECVGNLEKSLKMARKQKIVAIGISSGVAVCVGIVVGMFIRR